MICPNCKKEFKPRRKQQKYCSVLCARGLCHKIYEPKFIEKDKIIRLYHIEKLSMRDVAKRLGCGETMVHKWLHRSNISIRTRSESLLGKRKAPEHVERHRLAIIGKYRLDKNPNWKGGKSFEIYPIDFSGELKLLIRKRDRFRCRLCGSKKALTIHHIDYDKKNSQPENLVCLCRRCHSATNFHREEWLKFWNNYLKMGLIRGKSFWDNPEPSPKGKV